MLIPAELILTWEQFQDTLITTNDPILGKVANFIQQGLSNHCEQPELKPYWSCRVELSYFEGCILCGTRVLIPILGRQ